MIPEGVTTLESTCFLGCDQLARVDLPASLTKINFRAFARSSALDTVIVRAMTPPTLEIGDEGQTPFDRIGDEAVLWVPQAALDSYRNNETWSELFTEIRPLEDLFLQVVQPTNQSENIILKEHVLTVQAEGNIVVYNSAGIILSRAKGTLSIQLPQQGGVYLLSINGRVTKILDK